MPDDLLRKWKATLEADAAKGSGAELPPPPAGGELPPMARQRLQNLLSNLPPARMRARLDYELEVLRTLTSLQLRNGFRYAVPDELPESAAPFSAGPRLLSNGTLSPAGRSLFSGDAQHIVASTAILRFYETLGDRQRDDLIAGKLDFRTLTPAQKQRALRSVSREKGAPEGGESSEGSEGSENGAASPFFLGLSQDVRRLVGSSGPVARVPRSFAPN